jgi:Tfp pilus assembly protein PilP
MDRRANSLGLLPCWGTAPAVIVALMLVGGFLPALPALAQADDAPSYEDPTEVAEGSVNEILEAEEEMLANEGYNYDPGNRRDPFRSLLATRELPRLAGPRPEGIPGLLVDELDLTGIFITGEGPVAQVLAANKNESHLLRVGDRLYDGDVVSISREEIVFRQVVDDPAAIKPFREVVKKLNP